MVESKKKRQPAWLTGEPDGERPPRRVSPGGHRGPLADDTGEMQSVATPNAADSGEVGATRTVPRISAPVGTQEKPPQAPLIQEDAGEGFFSVLSGRLRENPKPALFAFLALLAMAFLFWFVFLHGGGEEAGSATTSGDRTPAAKQAQANPFAGGPVSNSGVKFRALQESGDTASLEGAGLQWHGTLTKKQDEAGETLTLEGPTAAQLERGFDLGPSAIETGVYAVAQDDGEVLHVTTHTFVPKEEGAGAHEMTLGSVYSLSGGSLDGYAFYLDQREPNSDTVTRTYVRPGESSYRVSYEAPSGHNHGSFVPLLVGWRGFENTHAGDQEGE